MSETALKPDPIIINSDQLAVEVAAPGSVYAGTRFDWTGFTTQVTLAGSHTYCAPEALEPGEGSGGIGLCNEFGIDQAVGYGEGHPGELFPKIGVGLLVRPDQADYDFFRTYEIAQRFPIEVETAENWARFVIEPLDCRGFSVRLTKTLTVTGPQLQIAYRLENTGIRPIMTNEYTHNFCAIDSQPLGPDYRLRFPYQIESEELRGNLFRSQAPAFLRRLPGRLIDRFIEARVGKMQALFEIEGNELRLNHPPEDSFYARLLGFSRSDDPQWELEHVPSGVKLCEYDDFTPMRVAVWGAAHVISAEVFVNLNLAPGAVSCWTRRYEFS